MDPTRVQEIVANTFVELGDQIIAFLDALEAANVDFDHVLVQPLVLCPFKIEQHTAFVTYTHTDLVRMPQPGASTSESEWAITQIPGLRWDQAWTYAQGKINVLRRQGRSVLAWSCTPTNDGTFSYTAIHRA